MPGLWTKISWVVFSIFCCKDLCFVLYSSILCRASTVYVIFRRDRRSTIGFAWRSAGRGFGRVQVVLLGLFWGSRNCFFISSPRLFCSFSIDHYRFEVSSSYTSFYVSWWVHHYPIIIFDKFIPIQTTSRQHLSVFIHTSNTITSITLTFLS